MEYSVEYLPNAMTFRVEQREEIRRMIDLEVSLIEEGYFEDRFEQIDEGPFYRFTLFNKNRVYLMVGFLILAPEYLVVFADGEVTASSYPSEKLMREATTCYPLVLKALEIASA
ncbi:MAG: hypothetical protein ACFB10_15350 [Salibacteraceae bacterium]